MCFYPAAVPSALTYEHCRLGIIWYARILKFETQRSMIIWRESNTAEFITLNIPLPKWTIESECTCLFTYRYWCGGASGRRAKALGDA
jgi:hypothetical protein